MAANGNPSVRKSPEMTPAEYKALREKLGTQKAVADLLGVTRETVARREQEGGRITSEAALAITALSKGKRAKAEGWKPNRAMIHDLEEQVTAKPTINGYAYQHFTSLHLAVFNCSESDKREGRKTVIAEFGKDGWAVVKSKTKAGIMGIFQHPQTPETRLYAEAVGESSDRRQHP